MDVFHGWILAIVVSVLLIVTCYFTAMFLIPDKLPRSRKRPWWWDLRRKWRRRWKW